MNRRIKRRVKPIVNIEKKIIFAMGNRNLRDVYSQVKRLWRNPPYEKYYFPFKYHPTLKTKDGWTMIGKTYRTAQRRIARWW